MKRKSGGTGLQFPDIVDGMPTNNMADDHAKWQAENFSHPDATYLKPTAIPEYVMPRHMLNKLRTCWQNNLG